MAKENTKNEACCTPKDLESGCCKVESIISIDERGQMILPKEVRDKANIKPQDKLAVVSFEKKGKAQCICLIKVENLTEMVKSILGPIMKELL
ncbi:MAG: HgcAB-associated protein [Candidatus Jordarchaeaceae archaeon]